MRFTTQPIAYYLLLIISKSTNSHVYRTTTVVFRALYPQAIFRMDPNERAVYLTFDDGPIPEVTPWVLELLENTILKLPSSW